MNWDWTHWALLGLTITGGGVAAWLGSRNRRAAQLLRACQARQAQAQSVLELFAHPLLLTAPDGSITWCNTAAGHLYEYSEQEMTGQPLRKLFSQDHAEEVTQSLARIQQGEPALRTETSLLTKSGRVLHVALSFTPVKDDAGRITAIAILTYDISKRRRTEEALAMEQFLVETLMENIPDHIYFKDKDSRFLRINKAMANAFKLKSPTDAIGKTDFDFFLPEHARQAFEDEQEIMRTGQPLVAREEKETWPDGSVTWASTTKVALRDGAGNIIGTFGISRDITDRKRAEAALDERTRELMRSNSELEHFAYAASHDLQEPLRMIASYLQLLVRRCDSSLGPEGKEFVGFAVDGAKRMQQLINDLLLYSRVGRHGQPFVLVDGNEVLARALANLKLSIEDSQAAVTSAPLPQVFGDPIQLTQLFQNLIGNAIKFRREAAPTIHISASFNKGTPREHAQGSLGEWVFAVRDNGIGIEPQYFERIFVIFQRLHTREKYPGTGIGLSICKRIVERHGGRMWVESQPGQGSTFYFAMPQTEKTNG